MFASLLSIFENSKDGWGMLAPSSPSTGVWAWGESERDDKLGGLESIELPLGLSPNPFATLASERGVNGNGCDVLDKLGGTLLPSPLRFWLWSG
jgi:hypothetical protein